MRHLTANNAASAFVLDMDGVLFRTNDAKYRAMLGLFEGHPEKTTAISQFILRNGGVPRAEKLKHILESIVGIAASEALVDEYLVKYQHALEGALSAASFVPGVEDFVSACECPYICVRRLRQRRSPNSSLRATCRATLPKSSMAERRRTGH